ncbi:MAG: hypothetical protein BWX98_02655 [Candidatus Aminicenantes bacterium ADurb.Bin147]|nr:MAG: hypothetical protein BWX98_02655 [Candidatus Aminicenantes bacterium ADurb.Bin147]
MAGEDVQSGRIVDRLPVQEKLQRPGNRGQRGPQLMGGVDDEVFFHFVDPPPLGHVGEQEHDPVLRREIARGRQVAPVPDLHVGCPSGLFPPADFDEVLEAGVPDRFQESAVFAGRFREKGMERLVGKENPAVPADHGQAFPDRGDDVRQLFLPAPQVLKLSLQPLRHRVENLGQMPKLPSPSDSDFHSEIPAGDLFGSADEGLERAGQPESEEKGGQEGQDRHAQDRPDDAASKLGQKRVHAPGVNAEPENGPDPARARCWRPLPAGTGDSPSTPDFSRNRPGRLRRGR